LEEKQKHPMAPGIVQGYGQAFVFSKDQKLDWFNMFVLGIEPVHVIRQFISSGEAASQLPSCFALYTRNSRNNT
jgi:hypothetical protein